MDSDTPSDPVERAVNKARLLDRITALEIAEQDELVMHRRHIGLAEAANAKLDLATVQLVTISGVLQRSEDRELEQLRLAATERKESRRWVADKVAGPLATSVVSFVTLTLGAAAAWAAGVFDR